MEEVYATLVEIREEPTALYKILKIANAVSGGGEAKLAISEGYVFLNGEVETQKRKKIMAGDLIFFNDQYFQVALKGETQHLEFSAAPQESNTPKKKKARPPISF
jgi:ribosome-associated protein